MHFYDNDGHLLVVVRCLRQNSHSAVFRALCCESDNKNSSGNSRERAELSFHTGIKEQTSRLTILVVVGLNHLSAARPDAVDFPFTKEVTLLQRLKHPNIVSIRGGLVHNGVHLGEPPTHSAASADAQKSHPSSTPTRETNLPDTEFPFLSGPFICVLEDPMYGCSVRDFLVQMKHDSELRPIQAEHILAIALDILEALLFLHQHHIVHRGIRIANILLDKERNCAKLCDFACAEQHRPLPCVESLSKREGSAAPADDHRAIDRDGFSLDLWSLGLAVLEMTIGAASLDCGELIQAYVLALSQLDTALDEHTLGPIPDLMRRKDFQGWLRLLLQVDPGHTVSAARLVQHSIFNTFQVRISSRQPILYGLVNDLELSLGRREFAGASNTPDEAVSWDANKALSVYANPFCFRRIVICEYPPQASAAAWMPLTQPVSDESSQAVQQLPILRRPPTVRTLGISESPSILLASGSHGNSSRSHVLGSSRYPLAETDPSQSVFFEHVLNRSVQVVKTKMTQMFHSDQNTVVHECMTGSHAFHHKNASPQSRDPPRLKRLYDLLDNLTTQFVNTANTIPNFPMIFSRALTSSATSDLPLLSSVAALAREEFGDAEGFLLDPESVTLSQGNNSEEQPVTRISPATERHPLWTGQDPLIQMPCNSATELQRDAEIFTAYLYNKWLRSKSMQQAII